MDNSLAAGNTPERLAVRDYFIGCLLVGQGSRPTPTAANQPWLAQLARAAFLASPAMTQLVYQTIPGLLRKLSCRTQAMPVELQGKVRGHIDWQATWKARNTKQAGVTTVVCREVQRQYATLENELIRYLLEQINSLTRTILPVLRLGAYWSVDEPYRSSPLQPRLADLQEQTQRQLKHTYMRAVSAPERISTQHLLRARCSKTEEYGLVADCFENYVKVAVEVNLPKVASLLHSCVVLPATSTGDGKILVELAAYLLSMPATSRNEK